MVKFIFNQCNEVTRNFLARGFTLIEVLIALSIIGMAMMAAIYTSESTTRNLQHIQDRTLAEWVAQNALVTMQLRIDGLRPAAGRWQSTAELAGRTWFWQAFTSATMDPSIVQITVEVRGQENASPLATLITYWSTEELNRR